VTRKERVWYRCDGEGCDQRTEKDPRKPTNLWLVVEIPGATAAGDERFHLCPDHADEVPLPGQHVWGGQ